MIAAIDAVVSYEFADPEHERRGWQAGYLRDKVGAEAERIEGLIPNP